MFDSPIGSLIELGALGGDVKPSLPFKSRGKSVGLAAGLLRALPNFDVASMRELIDIRKSLDRPLVAFRAGMGRIADGISVPPWDAAFDYEVEQVLIRDVRPAIQEINDSIETDSYLKSLVSRFARDPKSYVAAGGISLSGISIFFGDFDNFVRIGSMIAGLVPAALTAVDVEIERRKSDRTMQRQQMFFYYEADRRLTARQ